MVHFTLGLFETDTLDTTTPTRTKNRLFFLFKTGINARGLQWQEVSNHLKLQANHIPFLKRIAELHGALYD